MPASSLKISECPSAFEEFARKHNALVDLIRSMAGTGGIKVTTSDAKILFDGAGVAGSGGGTVVSTSYSVVGYDGKLIDVIRSGATTPSSYPTFLRVVNSSTSIDLSSTGFSATNSSNKSCTISFAAITADMSVREIDVCENGLAKKMLIVGSAPY